MEIQVDVKKLQNMAKKNTTYRHTFSFLANRKRASRESDVLTLKSLMLKHHPLKSFDHEAYANFWRDLESLGLGKLELSPRGLPKKFYWDGINPISVGNAALGKSKGISEARFRKDTKLVKPHRVPTLRRQTETMPSFPDNANAQIMTLKEPNSLAVAGGIYMSFMTQGRETIKFNLQNGITQDDKKNLIEFIEEIPIRA